MWRCLLFLFCLITVHGRAQYKPFGKLETLYKKGQFEACIEKAKKYNEKNRQELYPYYWQLKSNLALLESTEGPRSQVICNKVLHLAIKINKKDLEKHFKDFDPSLIQDVQTSVLRRVFEICAVDSEKAYQLIRDLSTISPGITLVLADYQCRTCAGDPKAFLLLEGLLEMQLKENSAQASVDTTLPPYFAALAWQYYLKGEYNRSLEVCNKSFVLYQNSTFIQDKFKDVFTRDPERLYGQIGLNRLLEHRRFIQELDRRYPHAETESYLIKSDRFLAQVNLDLATRVDSREVFQALTRYATHFINNEADSLQSFFTHYVKDRGRTSQLTEEQLYTYWMDAIRHYLRSDLAAVSNWMYYQLKENQEWQLCKQLLHFSGMRLPGDKAKQTRLRKDFEAAFLKEIKSAHREELLSIQVNAKEVKTAQLQAALQLIKQLTEEKKFSQCALLIRQTLVSFPENKQVLELKKQFILADYKASFDSNLPGQGSFFKSKPDLKKCEAGEINAYGFQTILNRIHYLRRLAGISDTCYFKPELNRKCQQAALMMDANKRLDHFPKTTWTCYSKEGSLAANKSNLSLGHGFLSALMGQMTDAGESNYACGHRRWILNPKNRVFGFGSTENAMSLMVFGSESYKENKHINFNDSQFIAWPSADYFPMALMPERWSFSLAGADFKNSRVKLSLNGKTIPVKIEPLQVGYALNTLVWSSLEKIVSNQTYFIEIDQVVIGQEKPKKYQYKIVFLETP